MHLRFPSYIYDGPSKQGAAPLEQKSCLNSNSFSIQKLGIFRVSCAVIDVKFFDCREVRNYRRDHLARRCAGGAHRAGEAVLGDAWRAGRSGSRRRRVGLGVIRWG